MIIEVRAKNCYAFEDDITFSMKADPTVNPAPLFNFRAIGIN